MWELNAIHHIGSTAVKWGNEKPIMDIMPVVKSITKLDLFNQAMRKHGYKSCGENGILGKVFSKRRRSAYRACSYV
ncbi:GrpB family protein [Virgibacillus salarius]|uniref:GrpB family protein n=1 Tax=Virgibacillus salarius TaxID=447199 RepID=UPI001FE68EBA|nr:GrpB family protein [Virgibacillus salarius]